MNIEYLPVEFLIVKIYITSICFIVLDDLDVLLPLVFEDEKVVVTSFFCGPLH